MEEVQNQEIDFKFDPSNPLGTVEESKVDPEAAGIIEYGLTTKLKTGFTTTMMKAKPTSVVFPDKVDEIIWYAFFGVRGGFKNNFSRRYHVQWYAPDGTLYLEEDFKAGFINETVAKTSLRLNLPLKDSFIGRWRVRVWKKNTLLDDRYFEIVRTS